ncbi:development/cell death domain-containing protein [Tanacetum coccineum]
MSDGCLIDGGGFGVCYVVRSFGIRRNEKIACYVTVRGGTMYTTLGNWLEGLQGKFAIAKDPNKLLQKLGALWWIMATTSNSYVRPSLATYASNDTQHLAAVLRLFCDFIPVLEPLSALGLPVQQLLKISMKLKDGSAHLAKRVARDSIRIGFCLTAVFSSDSYEGFKVAFEMYEHKRNCYGGNGRSGGNDGHDGMKMAVIIHRHRTMADTNEVDEALKVDEGPKLNSNPGEDTPQSDNAPSIILSNVEKEEDDNECEDEGESEEDEDAIVVVNGEGTNTDKEQNKGDVVKKDEKKAGETKNGEELAENFKRKEKRARPRNKNKKKDTLKASGTLAVVEDKPKSSI